MRKCLYLNLKITTFPQTHEMNHSTGFVNIQDYTLSPGNIIHIMLRVVERDALVVLLFILFVIPI